MSAQIAVRSLTEKPAAGEAYYRNGSGLRAKHGLDRNDSGRDFPNWALTLAPLEPTDRILDAGSGWGRFTWPLVESFGVRPENMVMLDPSEGMLRTAGEEAARRELAVKRCAGEIEALPLATGAFDGALANHVLYFLSNLRHGIGELARVLRPDGWLLATTNSERIPVLLIELHYTALTRLGVPFTPEAPSAFSMENGADALRMGFRQVECHEFVDTTTYTKVEDLVSVYAATGRYRNLMASPDIDETVKHQLLPTYERLVRAIFEREGLLRVPKLMGAFVCRDPLHSHK